jgi:hypothetical protein
MICYRTAGDGAYVVGCKLCLRLDTGLLALVTTGHVDILEDVGFVLETSGNASWGLKQWRMEVQVQ